jgi:hypothetical protein
MATVRVRSGDRTLSDLEIQLASRLYVSGHPIADLAKSMDKSERTVRRMFAEQGCERRPAGTSKGFEDRL